MTQWLLILAGAACTFVLKLSGYLVPASWLEHPKIARVNELLPAAMLAALVTSQTITSAGQLVIDARLAALGTAAVLLVLRAPFLVVVIAGAAVAAGLRALGWG